MEGLRRLADVAPRLLLVQPGRPQQVSFTEDLCPSTLTRRGNRGKVAASPQLEGLSLGDRRAS